MEYVFAGIMLFTVLLIIGLGIAIKYFRAYWLIAGYNSMSKEQKDNVDVTGLASFIGNMCFVMGALMALGTVLILVGQGTPAAIVFAGFFPLSLYIVVKSQGFGGKN